MNITDSTTTSARLHTVQQLLERLGSMKAQGLGARERLDFLQSQGPELAEGFSIEDAFDADARASSARISQLGELDACVRQLETAWRGAPIPSDVRTAGSSLIGHISGFVQGAQKTERESEIDMLSQLWETAPDVSGTWPELRGFQPRRKTVRQPHAIELEKAAAELVAAKDEVIDELSTENAKATELPKDGQEKVAAETSVKVLDEADTARLKAELERQARELDSGKHMRRDYEVKKDTDVGWDHRVVGQVSSFSATPGQESGTFEDMPQLRQQAWTEAVCEATLRPWRLEVCSSSGHGDIMRWNLENDEGAYIRLETTRGRERGMRRVRLEWTDPKIRIARFERELPGAELEELHLDPSSFVAQAILESSG